LNSNHKVGVRITQKSDLPRYRLQIGSKEIYKDLIALGFMESKALNMSVPNVPDEFLGEFVRGYFDGDGNIWCGIVHKDREASNRALLLAFTSSSTIFLQGLYIRLKNQGIKGGSFIDYGTYYRLSYSTWDALKIYDLMYNREHYNLYLERKKAIFDRL